MGLHEDVTRYLTELLTDEYRILTAASASTAYMDAKRTDGEWLAVPEDQRTAEYMGVQQIVRAQLRKFNPDQEPDPSQLGLDIPEEKLLQQRYSVPAADGEVAYVPRSLLTEEQMQEIAGRLEALSVHYARHAKALRASWYREHGENAA